MFEKMLKKNSLILKLVMFLVTGLFVSWCSFLSLEALEEADRDEAERTRAK